MANSTVTTTEQPRSRMDSFVGEVLPAEKARLVEQALPRHLTYAKFESEFRDAVMANPDLLKCDPREVYKEVHNGASLGLRFNPVLGEIYLITGYSSKDRRHKPQLRIGFKGLIKLVRQTGEVSVINAFEVCAHDRFHVRYGVDVDLQHEPDVFSDRGPPVGYYAGVRFRDGGVDYEFMSLAEVEAVRDRYSDGWKAFKAGRISRTPWADSFGEMAKKTVLRRLLKRLPQSSELAKALSVDVDEAAPLERETLSPPRGRPRLAATLREIGQQQPREPAPEPQPIPPQPEPDEEEEYEEEEQEEDPSQGYDTREEKRMDQPPSQFENDDPERAALYAAGLEVANQGPSKLRWWRAKLPVEQAGKLTAKDIEQLTAIAKEVGKGEAG